MRRSQGSITRRIIGTTLALLGSVAPATLTSSAHVARAADPAICDSSTFNQIVAKLIGGADVQAINAASGTTTVHQIPSTTIYALDTADVDAVRLVKDISMEPKVVWAEAGQDLAALADCSVAGAAPD